MPDYKSPETIYVDPNADGVSCNGGHETLGHPKTWYSFDGKSRIECKYCDRVFIKKP